METPAELINLLPPERLGRLRRDYFYHLATVAFLLLTALLIIHAALLAPTRQYLSSQIATRTERLAALNQTLSSADEQQLSARLTTLSGQTFALAALATSTPQSAVLSKVLAEPHPSVSLTGFTFAPARGRTPETVTVSGTAATRDVLRSYYLTLSGDSFVNSANLPVSAYAAESAIPFTITLTLL